MTNLPSLSPHEYRDETHESGGSEATPWSSVTWAEKGHSEASRAKAAETVAWRQNLERQDVLTLRRRGLVPLAIADHVGISLSRTVRFLKEAGEEIPGYLTQSGAPKKEVHSCPHCGKAL